MGHRVSCPDFVGRVEELDVLGAALDAATDGRTATVFIGGEAGIGKTRLVEEFGEQSRHRGALVATGVCVPVDGGGLPYGPVVGILRDVTRQLGEAETARALGPLASGLGLGPGLGLGEPEDRIEEYSAVPRMTEELAKTRLFASVLAGLTRLAERSTVVLVVDDLQWADSGTAELLSFLTRNLTDTRVLLIGTYRSDEISRDHRLRPWLHEIRRQARVTPLSLEGLDRSETAELIGGILGQLPDWTLVEAVWARAQGNAFFTEELTAARHSPTLSAEVQGVIMTRVEGLSADGQRLSRLAAVAGPRIDHRLLDAVGVLEAGPLDAALGETVDRQVLVVDADGEGYRFRHALLREAVEAALLPGERARLHRQVAEALTADGSLGPAEPGFRVAELARHWWAAGEWSQAQAASVAAAEAAKAVWAFPEALAHLERALAAMDRLAPGATTTTARLELVEEASDVAYLGTASQRSVDLARQAIDAAEAGADAATLARLYALLGRNCWSIGDSDGAFAAYRQAAALVPPDPPSVTLARVLAEEARGLMLMARFGEAEERAQRALSVATAAGARAEEGHLLYTLGCSRASLGFYDEGIALVRQALAVAEELAGADDLNRAYMGLSDLLVASGELEAGAALVFDSAAMGEELWGVRLNGAAGNSVEALIRLGRYDEAEALLALTGNVGVGSCASGPSILRAEVAVRRGRFDEADQWQATAAELTVGLGDVQHKAVIHMQAAELALWRGAPDEAYEEVERAMALAAGTDDETYRPEMCALGVRALADRVAEAQAGRGRFDIDKARLLARGLVEEAEGLVEAPRARGGIAVPRSVALAALCRAEQSRLHDSDPGRWAEAVARWAEAGEPYPATYCRWREAEARLEGGTGRRRAEESLQEAWRVSAALGTVPLTDQIERLARRARIVLPDLGPPADGYDSTVGDDLGLTPREVEVLGQLAAGRTDREIAEDLFISKKTVSVHVSNILRKLDVTNRVEAGRIGQAQGLG